MFSYKNRAEDLKTLQDERFDVLVIGGGVTGAGVALQAQVSGLKTALIEKQDFSEGSSSRTTKLVHGGLRYLKTFDVDLVEETVRERAVLQTTAPHLLDPQFFLLPIYEGAGTFTLKQAEWALRIYDAIAGFDSDHPYYHKMLTKDEVLTYQPDLKAEGLIGGGLYLDYQSKDARLTLEIIKRAVEEGAVAVSRLSAQALTYDDQGQVSGAQVKDELGQESFFLSATLVVNAAGPWVDEVNQLDTAGDWDPFMKPTKGIHLIVDREKLSVDQPLYLDSGQGDDRMVFILPEGEKTNIGTTDTPFKGNLDRPRATTNDVDYLLETVNQYFPDQKLSLEDIEVTYSGLRPLIDHNKGRLFDATSSASVFESPSAISRGSDFEISQTGLFVISGGKLTDYRQMAQNVMDQLAPVFQEKTGRSIDIQATHQLALSGGDFNWQDQEATYRLWASQGLQAGLSEEEAQALARFYGSNTAQLLTYTDKARAYQESLDLPLSVILRVLYAIDEEAAYSPLDYYRRRTDDFLFHQERMLETYTEVQKLFALELGLTSEVVDQEDQAFSKEWQLASLQHLR